MGNFEVELPDDIIKDLESLSNGLTNILGEMTTAGAKVVHELVQKNAPKSFKKSKIMDTLKVTKVYKTKSDGATNTKVGFYGYFTNHKGVVTPAPLVANVFEYGTSTGKVRKQPFFRKSFKKDMIEKAMFEAQKKASGGLLDEQSD